MPRVLIIGYGNPLRGDDRLGWIAVERLEQIPELARDPSVEFVTCHQLTPELAESVSQVDTAIFIDAAAEGTPGTVRCDSLTVDASQSDALGHHFTPMRVLSYAKAIFGHAPNALVLSVTAKQFDLGEPLSPAVEAAIPAVIERVLSVARRS